MALKDTCKKMKALLEEIAFDMHKAEEGNKAAAQRVRKCTIAFAKIAKIFRKESVHAGAGSKRKSAKKAATKRKAPAKRKAAPKKKAAPKRKAAAKKRVTKPRAARRRK